MGEKCKLEMSKRNNILPIEGCQESSTGHLALEPFFISIQMTLRVREKEALCPKPQRHKTTLNVIA